MREPKGILTEDPVVLRILECIKHNGITEKDMMHGVGLDNTIMTAWKYRGSKSYSRYINKIAEFLGVSSDYLLKGIDGEVNMQVMTNEEIILVKKYRKLDYARKLGITDVLDNYLNAMKYEEIYKITK